MGHYLFENFYGNLLELSLINISSPLSSGVPKRNSPLTRSFHTKHPPRRLTRFKKQQIVVLVENEVVFQQLIKECTMKTKRMVIEKY